MVNDSAYILDDVTKDERYRLPIRYYNMTRSREEIITSCEGDLIVICNVLADYADLLDEFLKNEKERERLGFCAVMQYERMRDRCRKITGSLQEKTGYDREAAIEKCRRRAGRKPRADAGIGEDALVLSARRRAGEQQKTEQQPATESKKTE
ncbi:MAG: hypothetical protein K2K74_07180 [Lachnospiraceae bacterium]|nr:hypothetical protein [Lachnospiraceae bacterium]